MYEVMARRYRPAAFDEVVGQEHIAATLKNAISRDRVAHAYIFTGGHGCGKTTMARILAKALVCEKGPTPEPCGKCHICVDVAAGRDSDVLEIDGASNNGIEQIRLLREQAAYVPTRARYKIYIIDEVHMLSDGAFNALLKTLEEPPRHVKFILATTDPHKVPDTILSRCQRFDFRLVPQAKLSAFFRRLADEEKAGITDDALEAVASFAEGSVRDGLVLLDQLLSFADGEVKRQDVEAVRGVASAENVAGIFDSITRSDVKKALAIVDEVASRGTNTGDFLDQLVTFGRDLMILAATGSRDGLSAYGPARDTLLEIGKTTSLESALLYLDVLTQARTRVRSRALTNPLVALEIAIARLAGLGGVTPVAEILAQLEALPAGRPQNVAIPAPATHGTMAAPEQSTNPDLPAEKKIPEPVPAPSPTPAPITENPRPTVQAHPVANAPDAEMDVDAAPPPAAPSGDVKESLPGESGKVDADDRESNPGDSTAAVRKILLPPTIEEVRPLWDRVLDALADKHPADFRHMARVVLDGVKDGTVVLAGPPTAVEAWEDRRRRERLAEAARAVFKRDIPFAFVPRAAKRRDDNSMIDKNAHYNLVHHPVVEKVKELFDGVVINCMADIPGAAGGQDADEQGEAE